jgi:hypothetical protein
MAATPGAAHAPRQFDAEAVTRQLAQAVRGLNEDRDRLTTRLAALEQSLNDITGAITRGEEKAAPPAAQGTAQPPAQETSKTDGPTAATAPAENPPRRPMRRLATAPP